MKTFSDSHLEVRKFFKGIFFTHPYEADWVDEVIFFVMVEKIEGDLVFEGCVQLSQDGIHRADDGSEPVILKGPGQHIIKVNSNFGSYIRPAVSVEGGEMFLNLHIACKG